MADELLPLPKLLTALQARYPDLVVERVLDEDATEEHNKKAIKQGKPLTMVYETVLSRPIPLAQRQFLAETRPHDVKELIAALAWLGDAHDVIQHCKKAFPDLVVKREGNRHLLSRATVPEVGAALAEDGTFDIALEQAKLVDNRVQPEHPSWAQPAPSGAADEKLAAAVAGAVASVMAAQQTQHAQPAPAPKR